MEAENDWIAMDDGLAESWLGEVACRAGGRWFSQMAGEWYGT